MNVFAKPKLKSPSPKALAAAVALLMSGSVLASSHREAPFITTHPKVDASDFYLFRSYESGRSGYVTLIANYQPLQDPYGGPNYFFMDPQALYEIHVDNNGDGVEDLTFQFRFTQKDQGLTVKAGSKSVPVPLINIGPVSSTNTSAQNYAESYTLTLVRGDRRHGQFFPIADAETGSTTFAKPLDNIGEKSIPGYAAYADTFIKYPVTQLAPAGVNARNDEPNSLADKNVTSLALEIPSACLTAGSDPVIGAWTTASVRQAAVFNSTPQSDKSAASVGPVADPTGPKVAGGAWVQLSRLGAPLVNEVVIGLPDKDRYNGSEPKNDAQFADYVTNPSFPVLLQALFGSAGVLAPNVYPRADLVEVFLTGVPGLNQPKRVTPAEILRLNTSTAITPVATQNDLGVIGGDLAGYPNGRRPIDDVVDITLRAAMGVLLAPFDGSAKDPDPASDASRQLGYTDGAEPNPANYQVVFPYLTTPIPGSPNSASN
jgi:hypothetical protein